MWSSFYKFVLSLRTNVWNRQCTHCHSFSPCFICADSKIPGQDSNSHQGVLAPGPEHSPRFSSKNVATLSDLWLLWCECVMSKCHVCKELMAESVSIKWPLWKEHKTFSLSESKGLKCTETLYDNLVDESVNGICF